MNADFVLIFFKWKLKVVLYILVTIAIIEYPYTYSFYDRKLTQYHNSWTADPVATVTTVIISYCSINLVSQSRTIQIIDLSLSCVSIISIWIGYPLFRFILIINNFSQKSCVTVSYNGKSLFLSYINNLYLYSGWVSALSRCAAQRRPLAGHRPRPQTEVVILASTAAIWSCVQCQCVNVFTI